MKDGGPAFATITRTSQDVDWQKVPSGATWSNTRDLPQIITTSTTGGMSLRDYFAAIALQGDLASSGASLPPADSAAARAYEYADAMLKQREVE